MSYNPAAGIVRIAVGLEVRKFCSVPIPRLRRPLQR